MGRMNKRGREEIKMALIQILAVPQKSVHLTRRKSVRHQKCDGMEDLISVPTLYPSLNALLEHGSLESEESQVPPHSSPFS